MNNALTHTTSRNKHHRERAGPSHARSTYPRKLIIFGFASRPAQNHAPLITLTFAIGLALLGETRFFIVPLDTRVRASIKENPVGNRIFVLIYARPNFTALAAADLY